MKKLLQKISVFVFAIATLITSICPYYGLEYQDYVVRVGFYHMDGFQYYDEYAELQGYCIDYLDTLSTFTGWKYEFVPVEDFGDGCQKLKEKKIDLLAPAMMTEERKEEFDYSELSFGTEYTILVTDTGAVSKSCSVFVLFSSLNIFIVRMGRIIARIISIKMK